MPCAQSELDCAASALDRVLIPTLDILEETRDARESCSSPQARMPFCQTWLVHSPHLTGLQAFENSNIRTGHSWLWCCEVTLASSGRVGKICLSPKDEDWWVIWNLFYPVKLAFSMQPAKARKPAWACNCPVWLDPGSSKVRLDACLDLILATVLSMEPVWTMDYERFTHFCCQLTPRMLLIWDFRSRNICYVLSTHGGKWLQSNAC